MYSGVGIGEARRAEALPTLLQEGAGPPNFAAGICPQIKFRISFTFTIHMILHVHKDKTDSLDLTEVAREFSNNDRRRHFFGDF